MNTERESSQILKDILKPVPKNKRYYPFLEREDIEDRSSWFTNRLHKYSFKGFVNPEYYNSEIYLLFFKSFYNATGNRLLTKAANDDSRMKIKQNHISFFYKQFIRLIYLQSLVGQQGKRTDHAVTLLADTVGNKQRDPELQSITKGLINNYYAMYRGLAQKKPNTNYMDYEDTKNLRQEIKEVLTKLHNTVEQNWEQILQNEILPNPLIPQPSEQNPMTKNTLIMYVKTAFSKISNIYLLSRGRKRNMLENLQSSLSSYMTARLVIQTEVESKESRYFLHFSRMSNETEPVLTKLSNYMVIRRVNNKHSSSALKQSSLILVKDILAACRKYYRFVKKVYPLITAQDVIFDQKSLKPVLGHTSLIYDALAVQGKDVSSIQLQLAMSGTPKPVEFEKCYLQLQNDGEWALNRKYFLERRQKKENQDEIQRQPPPQFVQDDSDQQAELQKREGCPVKSKQIQEKAHIWRLICIFHQILKNGRHLLKEFYNKKYSKLAKGGVPPFRRDLYTRALKELHFQIQSNPKRIFDHLGLKSQNNWEFENNIFEFKLGELQKLLNMQQVDDDSMLERHRFEKSKTELWVRAVLRKQIFELILKDKYFKRMLNAKKYLIMFTVCSMEIAYETIYPIWQAQKKPGARKLLIDELNDQNQFKKLSFVKEKERERSNLQSINKRLNQYMGRNDEQNKYLSSNPEYKSSIKKIYEDCIFLLKSQRLFIEIEQNLGIQKQETIKTRYKESIAEATKKAISTFNTSSNILKELLEKNFDNKLQKLEDFHKFDSKISKDFYKYITKKFYYLIKAFHTVSPDNFRKYQTFVLPFLLQPKSLGIQTTRKIEDSKENELYELIARLDQIGEILNQQSCLKIGESERMEPKTAL